MDADWYEDPLGRYDGRFFDGEAWTDQVSVDGMPATDPDFPPDEPLFASSANAVEPLDSGEPRRATLVAESPTRVVAVLDDSIAPGGSAKPRSNSSLKWALVAGLLAAALVGFFLLRGDQQLNAAEEDRVDDLEASGLTSDDSIEGAEDLAAETITEEALSATYAEDEAVDVGTLRIVNGAVVLGELETWHEQEATERGINLGSQAGCWFGELAGAAVQVAQCGPVGGGDDSEYLFDLVPLLFAETEDGGYAAVALVDEVTPNAVLANTLQLVGHSASKAPPLSLEERATN